MIKVATIINTHGLKGECKLYLLTDDANHRFAKGRTLYLDQKTPMTILSYREQKGFGYVKLESIDSIEKAEELKTHTLWIKKSDLPELEEGEYYYHQLMGCNVFNEANEDLGCVSDILETGANLVLRITKDKKSFLCPFVDAFIISVDIEQKIICIKEMEGLR